ncbi:hypothetical protein H0H93_012540, partial [Arthromyces matolae]
MPSASGHYDEALLAAAPAATKAQIQANRRPTIQEGYTTDLLNHPPGNATPPFSSSQVDIERGLKESNGAVVSRSTPFYRTKKGLIAIVVVVVVLLAAVIGGAVGGTRSHHSTDTVSSSSSQTSGSGGQQGSGGSTGGGSQVAGSASSSG